jgi:hypothetical protein
MPYVMSDRDFEQLCVSSMQWGDQWRGHRGRFENLSHSAAYDTAPSYHWAYAYWLEEGAAALILAKSFLADLELSFEVLWDTNLEGFVLLTDYAYPTWARGLGE